MVNNIYSHQFTHAATVLTTFIENPKEKSEDLINKVYNNNNLLIKFTQLLSSDYSLDFVKSILLNEEFKKTLKKIRGDI